MPVARPAVHQTSAEGPLLFDIIESDGSPKDLIGQFIAAFSSRPFAVPETKPLPATLGAPSSVDMRIEADRGDTLMKMLVSNGADRRDADRAIRALSKYFNPRKLKAGQEITMTFRPRDDGADDGMELISVALAADIDREVLALRKGDGFAPSERVRELQRSLARADGEIRSSLYLAAREADLPDGLIMEMIRVLSWDVDFQRDIHKGDRFEVVYEHERDENGRIVRLGKIQYVSLDIGGKALSYWRHRPDDDKRADYFDAKGRSIRKALLRTPVNGAKLTSRYGKRRHPILGYTRVHRGVDFGAPTGTPIYAAGDGMVEVAKWEGNFGRYVRIRHNSEIKTAYAHMSRIAKAVKKGRRVRQGEIIGFVGSTGLSTGPHLHYEVIKKGRKINPLSVKLPTGRRLDGEELKRFQTARADLDRRIAEMAAEAEVAAAE